MDKETFLKKLDRIEDLPTLPTIAMEVNKMLQDYDTSMKDLTGAIEKDQAIVSKILKLVNSAFFGLQSKISGISHAIALLGFNTIRNAVISVSIIEVFPDKDHFTGFNISDFWKHSIAVAVTSKHLAQRSRLRTPDDSFIGGLLHDIGKVVLFQNFQDLFETVWFSSQENRITFYEAEKKEIPVHHPHIGGYLTKKWKLPVGLIEAIRHHHVVKKSGSDLNLQLIVHVADVIVHSLMNNPNGKPKLSSMDSEAVLLMGAQLDNVSEWFPEVSDEIDSASSFFLRS